MTNKFGIDVDPNGTQNQLLEAFFAYINAYERFRSCPSHKTRIESRHYLSEIHKLSKVRRIELSKLHAETRAKRQQLQDQKNSAKQKQDKG